MRKSRWLIWVRALIDVVALVAAVLLAYNYRFHVDRIPIPGTEPPALGYYLAAASLLGLIFVVTFAFSGVYWIWRSRTLLGGLFGIVGDEGRAFLVAM